MMYFALGLGLSTIRVDAAHTSSLGKPSPNGALIFDGRKKNR